MMRVLASLGLTIGEFTHEIRLALETVKASASLLVADIQSNREGKFFNSCWWIESNTWCPLLTAATILSGLAVHVKGFGSALVSETKRLIAACRSTTE
jgi:hypothetical protein